MTSDMATLEDETVLRLHVPVRVYEHGEYYAKYNSIDQRCYNIYLILVKEERHSRAIQFITRY